MRAGIIGIIVLALLLGGCDLSGKAVKDTSTSIQEEITLGFCPTMKKPAQEIAAKKDVVSLQPFGSTSAAISALNGGTVDIILVGRLAKSNELDAPERRLRKGLTLVGDEKRFISMGELADSRVHTAASEEKVNEYLPEETQVTYHDSFTAAIDGGQDETVLISWEHYTDDLELVIPVQGRSKIPRFRTPVLYSHDKGLLEEVV